MSLDGNVSDHQRTQIREFFKAGKEMKLEIQDRNEALKDLAKAVGDDIGVEPKLLSKALNVAFKNKAEDERENSSIVEDILAAAGEI